jgi:hypothetical protein
MTTDKRQIYYKRDNMDKKMKRITYLLLIVLIPLIVSILFSILVLVYLGFLLTIDTDETMVRCCDNMTCSDTYYSSEDNLCHYSLCESNLFNSKSDCSYKPK